MAEGVAGLVWNQRPDGKITLTIEDGITHEPLAHVIYTKKELHKIAQDLLRFTEPR